MLIATVRFVCMCRLKQTIIGIVHRNASNMSTTRSLDISIRNSVSNRRVGDNNRLTKVILLRTPALPLRVCLTLRTMLEWLMSVSNIVEEVDLIFAREEGGADGMNRRVAPSLVVEPALGIEVLEELAVRLAAPEVEVSDLEIAPDCVGRQLIVRTYDRTK